MRERERASAMVATDATPSLDLVFDLLSNRRRRYALYYLYEQSDGVATIDDLTDHVAGLEVRALEAENDTESISEPEVGTESTSDSTTESEFESASTAAGDRRQRIQTELQHVHLPKLEDAGILEHDLRSETVRYWTQPSLEEWLEHAYHKEL